MSKTKKFPRGAKPQKKPTGGRSVTNKRTRLKTTIQEGIEGGGEKAMKETIKPVPWFYLN